jgi:hypothetical protein
MNTLHPDFRKETDLPFTLPFSFQDFKNNPARVLKRVKFVTPRSPGKTTKNTMIAVLYTTAFSHAQRMRGRFVHQRKGRSCRRHAIRKNWIDRQSLAKSERSLETLLGSRLRFCPLTVFTP